jgi:hypothetical protein
VESDAWCGGAGWLPPLGGAKAAGGPNANRPQLTTLPHNSAPEAVLPMNWVGIHYCVAHPIVLLSRASTPVLWPLDTAWNSDPEQNNFGPFTSNIEGRKVRK